MANLLKTWWFWVCSAVVTGIVLPVISMMFWEGRMPIGMNWIVTAFRAIWSVVAASWAWIVAPIATARLFYWFLLFWFIGSLLIVISRLVQVYRRQPSPEFMTYTTDRFSDVLWRWRYDEKEYQIEEIASFCPHCDTRLLIQDDWGGTTLHCATHGVVHRSNRSYSDIVRFVKAAIEKKVRYKEYKEK